MLNDSAYQEIELFHCTMNCLCMLDVLLAQWHARTTKTNTRIITKRAHFEGWRVPLDFACPTALLYRSDYRYVVVESIREWWLLKATRMRCGRLHSHALHLHMWVNVTKVGTSRFLRIKASTSCAHAASHIRLTNALARSGICTATSIVN